MRAFLLATLSVGLILGLGACERHSWDSTKRLFPAPPEAETTAPTDEEDHPGDDQPKSSERDTSVLP